MLFTDTMTVYNHYMEDGQDKYKRTIVRGVQWSHSRVMTTTSGNAMSEDRVESITIDFDANYGNEQYINPIEFKKEDDHIGHWTLNQKDGKDIALLGVGNEITPDYTVKQLKADHQYIGTVISVADNRNRQFLKTIKVVVK